MAVAVVAFVVLLWVCISVALHCMISSNLLFSWCSGRFVDDVLPNLLPIK